VTEAFTKSMARNIFYGGSIFFLLLFLALTFDTMRALPKLDNRAALDSPVGPKIAKGKELWEVNNCIGCHTLLGEGAYFAPELGNVYKRYGSNLEAVKGRIKGLISFPAEGIPTRRMPLFKLTDEEIDALAEFLKYASEINTSGWPPNDQG